jgi:hypothetical protein
MFDRRSSADYFDDNKKNKARQAAASYFGFGDRQEAVRTAAWEGMQSDAEFPPRRRRRSGAGTGHRKKAVEQYDHATGAIIQVCEASSFISFVL